MFVDAGEGEVEIDQMAFPLQMSGFAFAVERAAPGQGEHSREVLREIGYEHELIDELEGDGVI